MKNKINDLRNHLFETIELLKDDEIAVDKAKTIAALAQVVVNSAKVELDFMIATEKVDNEFFISTTEVKQIK